MIFFYEMKRNTLLNCTILFLTVLCLSCKSPSSQKSDSTLMELKQLLTDASLSAQSRHAVINRIANQYYSQGKSDEMVLFLTDWTENHPSDIYNAYYLYMIAMNYVKSGSEPLAEYYFERVLNNFSDLTLGGQSIHFSCLQNLINITKSSANRIAYFNRLINTFPQNISITEMYVRLAMEYEKEGEWDQALKSYELFLEQPDSSAIQIAGIPEAYAKARQMVNFSKSQKDWTFESLEDLEKAVKTAISKYDWRSLDRYRTRVNFFAMSWKSSESDANALENFSMHNFMLGNKIRYNEQLDESSTPTEAYLKTWGWSQYINVWYLYFRKVNFPTDPEIHGNWEWAGIYFGEKL